MNSAANSSSRWQSLFRNKLLGWYAKHRRDLPWRRTANAYGVWVSETMLQQTQVATVVDYYRRFMDLFPTVEDLARAEEQEVLRLWSGLGYYRRAKQLHAAARIVARDFAGQMPSTVEELVRLPGIGRYTAGAIASIAFDARAPILEANTLRLFSRLTAMREDPRSHRAQQKLWEFAASILPNRSGSGEVNQALMELGSLVCKPRQPDCPSCPVVSLCPTAAQGLQSVIPPSPTKKPVTNLRHAALIIQRSAGNDQPQLLMRRNPSGAWWAGLWDVPRVDLTNSPSALAMGAAEALELNREIESRTFVAHDLPVKIRRHILSMRHTVTRYRIHLDCFQADFVVSSRVHCKTGSFQWMHPAETLGLPLSSTTRRIIAFLTNESINPNLF